MCKDKADIKADMGTGVDRGESPLLMEPLYIASDSRFRSELNDLAVELAARVAGFRHRLPEGMLSSLASLVSGMNCYYSNLIEGHDTHPVDIERALKNDYSTDPQKRNLQLEAKAHMAVQAWIDEGGLQGRCASAAGIREIHKRFGEHLPNELLWVENPETGNRTRVIPGELRDLDVKVGRHIPISPGALLRFLSRYEQAFSGLGKFEQIIGVAAAHHRLLWIHPFFDGNGRVARLMSHAMLLESLDTGGVWSVARGLARQEKTYKKLLSNCDLQRRNDLDGRGNLSEESLAAFSLFFLQTCLDQVDFMEKLVQPDRLRHRVLSWAGEEVSMGVLPAGTEIFFEALLYRGEISRSEIPNLLGVGERQARRVVSALLDKELVVSASTRAPIHLAFPARLAPRWMPGLFPEK